MIRHLYRKGGLMASIENNLCSVRGHFREEHYEISVSLPDSASDSHRYTIVFQAGSEERLLPIPDSSGTGTEFSCQYPVADLFFHVDKGATVSVSVLDTSLLPASETDFHDSFSMPFPVAPMSYRKRRIRRAVGLLLLPAFTVHGLAALCGITAKRPECAGKSGMRALIYHVNGMLRSFAGTGYSKRDRKIFALEGYYRKACRSAQPDGILLLSERSGPLGDNFDEIYPLLAPSCRVRTHIPVPQIQSMTGKELRRYADELAGAKLIVLNEFLPELNEFMLRPESRLIQLWHACGAFKQFGYSHFGLPGGLSLSSKSHRTYHYAYVSSDTLIPIYAEAFGISRSCILPLGVPRTDCFYRPDYALDIRKRLWARYPVLAPDARNGQPEKPFTVLFAPTFRGHGIGDAYYPEEVVDYEELLSVLPANACLIVRHHPFVKQVPVSENPRILVLPEERINDLLFTTDVLITDYSSVVFEAAVLHIPMLFYTFDLAEYRSGRNFYFPMERFAPGALCTDWKDLLQQLSKPESIAACDPEFTSRFFLHQDGGSAERVAGHLKSLLND